MCFTHVSFFHEFWVALSALWDRLTCNPSTYMQSKHTFQFLHFFLKSLSEDLKVSHFLSNVWPTLWFLSEKIGSKNYFKKRCPSRLKQVEHSQARRLPEKQPHVRAVQTRNSCLSSSWSTVWDFCRKKWTGLKIGVKKWLDSWIVAKKTEWTVDFWKLRQV